MATITVRDLAEILRGFSQPHMPVGKLAEALSAANEVNSAKTVTNGPELGAFVATYVTPPGVEPVKYTPPDVTTKEDRPLGSTTRTPPTPKKQEAGNKTK